MLIEESAVGERTPFMLLANAVGGRLKLPPASEVRVQRCPLREEPRDTGSRVPWQPPGVEPLGESLAERRLATDAVSAPTRRVLELELRLALA
jgi:hypothetical protein